VNLLFNLSGQQLIFPRSPQDIVVRVEGDYSLKFHVFDVDPDSNEPSPILAR
jgi:hypothetical protein